MSIVNTFLGNNHTYWEFIVVRWLWVMKKKNDMPALVSLTSCCTIHCTTLGNNSQPLCDASHSYVAPNMEKNFPQLLARSTFLSCFHGSSWATRVGSLEKTSAAIILLRWGYVLRGSGCNRVHVIGFGPLGNISRIKWTKRSSTVSSNGAFHPGGHYWDYYSGAHSVKSEQLICRFGTSTLKSVGAQSWNDLQWLDLNIGHRGPLLLIWISLNPAMDK